MDNLDKGLEHWLSDIENKTTLTNAEKSEITGAGAKVFAEVLKKNTPVSGVDYGKSGGKRAGHATKGKREHLKDMITYTPGIDAEKENTGNTVVGYDGKYFNFVASIVNNGKRKMSEKEMQNLHFVEKSRQEAEEAVRREMALKFKQLKEQ